MGQVKSDNRFLGIQSGHYARWIHNDGSRTTTITPRSTEPVVLHRLVVNTTSASTIIIRDSAAGVIAVLKASIAEGAIQYGVKCKGNLIVEVAGASDVTIVFSND